MTEGETLKHLDFIQAVVTRQASNSFLVKGWSLTVASAFYAYIATHLKIGLALLSLLPVAAFAWLDAYFLQQERKFRCLYEAVIIADGTVPLLSLRTDLVDTGYAAWRHVVRSTPWIVLHTAIALVGIVLLGVSIAH